MNDSAEAPGGTTLKAALLRLAAALFGQARTRLELASVEYAEERTRVIQQLVLLVLGLGCVLFAVGFAAAGIVAYFWDPHRVAAFLGVVVVFAGAGAVLLWKRAEVAASAPRPFAATIEEFAKDGAALRRSANLPPGP
jgi:uncharacterized membrane protein YqjE